MRIGFVITLAVALGLCTGMAAALAEFGYYDEVTPKLDVSALPLPLHGPPPRLVIDKDKHEFGEVEQTDVQRHVFEVRNEGVGNLELKPGKGDCVCTVGKVAVDGKDVPPHTNAVIPPGKSAQVTIQWTPGKAAFGTHEKPVTFPTNDPSTPILTLKVRGTVVGNWQLVPPSIGFHNLGVNETRQSTANLLIYRAEKWQIQGHTWTSKKGTDHIDVAYAEIPADELAKMNPPPKSGYKLTLTARKGMPAGPLAETVTFDISPKNSLPVTLPVMGSVFPSVSLMSNYSPLGENHELLLGNSLPQGKAHHQDLQIRLSGEHRKDTKLSVKKVVPEDLKVSFGEPKNLGEGLIFVPLKIELPATAKPQAWLSTKPEEMGQVVIETTNPDVKELKLFVRFAIVDPTAAPAVPANPKK